MIPWEHYTPFSYLDRVHRTQRHDFFPNKFVRHRLISINMSGSSRDLNKWNFLTLMITLFNASVTQLLCYYIVVFRGKKKRNSSDYEICHLHGAPKTLLAGAEVGEDSNGHSYFSFNLVSNICQCELGRRLNMIPYRHEHVGQIHSAFVG